MGSFEFPLKLVPRRDPIFEDGVDEETDGLTIFESNKRGIYLVQDLAPREMFDTLWHELTHAVNFVGGIEDGAEEEVIAAKHGEVWTQVMLDNPRLQAWFTYQINSIRKDRAGP